MAHTTDYRGPLFADSVLDDLLADSWFQAQQHVTAHAAPRHRGMAPAATRDVRHPVAASAERHSREVRAASWI